jgi:hypothetical protein
MLLPMSPETDQLVYIFSAAEIAIQLKTRAAKKAQDYMVYFIESVWNS